MPEKPGVYNPPSIEVQDEGVVVGHVRRIDFVGGSVEASLNSDTVVVTVPTAGSGIGTHSFLDAYHFHPNAAPSGNVLTAIGSANVPTYAPPSGGMATHSFGGAWHDVDTWANFASRLSDGVPIKVGDSVASLGLWAGHIGSVDAHYSHAGHAGSLGAHVVWPIVVASISGFAGHVGSVGAHHVKYTDGEAQAIADTQVSIHVALVGIHHSPTHSLGGADHNPDTFANLLAKISDAVLLKVGDSAASLGLWAGHLGSANAHHAKYLDAEAQAMANTQVSIHAALVGIHHSPTHSLGGAEHVADTWANFITKATGHNVGTLGGTIVASQHPNTHHQVGGISPLFSKRAVLWYVSGTQAVGSQLSAIMYADGAWTLVDVRANMKVAPSGGKVHINILAAGATLCGSLPHILTGSLNSAGYAFATAGIASGAKLTLDLTEVGSSHAGEHLTVQLMVKEPVI